MFNVHTCYVAMLARQVKIILGPLSNPAISNLKYSQYFNYFEGLTLETSYTRKHSRIHK